MIPKTIHYCWFGHNPKPALMQRCILSWKRFCPDYTIIEWNEDNFDTSINDYVKEAYEAQKWAFVTDFARLWIVYKNGGIYLDTDVELIKPLDSFLGNAAFFGFENNRVINTGLGFGAEAGNPIVGQMLSAYDGLHFKQPDGSYDLLPCPARNTGSISHLLPNGYDSSEIIQIDSARFFPPEYFCPLSSDGTTMKKTAHTHSIHWFSATWLTGDEHILHEWRVFRGKCEKRMGKKIGGLFARVWYLFLPGKRRVLKRLSNTGEP